MGGRTQPFPDEGVNGVIDGVSSGLFKCSHNYEAFIQQDR